MLGRTLVLVAVATALVAAPAAAATPVHSGGLLTAREAQAQPRNVELVDGRFYLFAAVFADGTTRITDLKVWDYKGGSAISLVCTSPGCPIRNVCPGDNCTDPTTGVGNDTRGVTDLTRNVRKKKLTPGTRFEVRITEPDGRTKTVEYVTRRKDVPMSTRTCFLPTRSNGSFDCAGPCEPFAIDPSRRCEELGAEVPSQLGATKFAVTRKGRNRGTTRVKRLELVTVPAGAFVETFCQSFFCPFNLKLEQAQAPRPRVDVAHYFGKKRIPAGVKIEARVNQADQVGHAFAFTTTKKKVKGPERRCLYPEQLEPIPCR